MNNTPQNWKQEYYKKFQGTEIYEDIITFIETQIALASEKAYNKGWLEAKEDAVMGEI